MYNTRIVFIRDGHPGQGETAGFAQSDWGGFMGQARRTAVADEHWTAQIRPDLSQHAVIVGYFLYPLSPSRFDLLDGSCRRRLAGVGPGSVA
jgi:hypothetical protein